jgi:hypothetical protein
VITVTLSFPDGQDRNVMLRDVPRVGEHIRLKDARPGDPSYVVEQVLWREVANGRDLDPGVIVSVHPYVKGPRG